MTEKPSRTIVRVTDGRVLQPSVTESQKIPPLALRKKQAIRLYYRKNKSAVRENNRQYYEKNKQALAAKSRERYRKLHGIIEPRKETSPRIQILAKELIEKNQLWQPPRSGNYASA